jgi:hypothetical protein
MQRAITSEYQRKALLTSCRFDLRRNFPDRREHVTQILRLGWSGRQRHALMSSVSVTACVVSADSE